MRGSLLLARRRLRRDAALVFTLTALVAFATVLAVAVPRLVTDTVDAGAREEIQSVGTDADVLVSTFVGVPTRDRPAMSPEQVIELQQELPGRLPSALSRVAGELTLTVVSDDFTVATDLDIDRVTARIALLTPEMEDRLRIVSGTTPAATAEGAPIEVVVPAVTGLELGTMLTAKGSTLVVVGLAEQGDESAERDWIDLPGIWTSTVESARGSTDLEVMALASPAGVEASYGLVGQSLDATVRIALNADRFTGELIDEVADELGFLAVNSTKLESPSGGQVEVRSTYKNALKNFEGKARGAIAQMSIMIAGVLGVCLVVVLQLSRLLVLRRASEFALERARGASVASVGVRGVLESILVAVVGVGAGLAIAGVPADLVPIVLILVVALLAAPVQSMMLAGAGSRPRRAHTDRVERTDAGRRRAAGRIAIEFLVVALAVAALVSIRSRGLLQTRTDGVDPLLAAAPLLLAAAVTVVVLRVHPPVVRAISRLARRSRGVLGILGAMQAARSLAVVPMLALTLSIGLVVAAGLLVETVRTGQIEASWQRVGADVRVDGPLPLDVAETAAAKPGVTAASQLLSRGGVEAKAGLSTAITTVLAVDDRYADVLDRLPQDAGADVDLSVLRGTSAGGLVPVLVSPDVIDRLPLGPVTLDYGDDFIDAEVVGTLPGGPVGYLNDPFVYIDLETLVSLSTETLEPTSVLIMGSGAAAAAPDGEVIVRADWLAERQQQAFVIGVQQSMLVAAGAVGLLAIFALVAAVQAGSRARGRSLSLLRTLGLRPRLGWWLALAELAPVVIAALAGGILAGVVIVVVCAPSLGLRVLAGGIDSPPPSISPLVVAAVAAGGVLLLALAVLTEVIAHRRDRLSEVLRVGETV